MRTEHIDNMKGGWFVGDFDPVAFHSKLFEVGYKEFKKDEPHQDHYHKEGTEINLVAYGRVEFNGVSFGEGSIVIIEPGEVTKTKFLEDSGIFVAKTPSLPNDKYVLPDNAENKK